MSGVVHVFGDPEPAGMMERVDGHWCDEPDDVSRPAASCETVFHRKPLQCGVEWVCLACGETTCGEED